MVNRSWSRLLQARFSREEYEALGAGLREARTITRRRHLFAEYELDAVVSIANLFSGSYAVAGYPAITVPAGLDASGTPFGLTFTGRLYEEAQIIGYGYAFEQASRLRQVP